MTEDEYRAAILEIDIWYDKEILRLQCRKQSGNATFVRVPELVYFTPEAREIQHIAHVRMEQLDEEYWGSISVDSD